MTMRISVRQLRGVISEEVGRLVEAKPKVAPMLPTLDDAEKVVSDAAYKTKGGMPKWRALLAALTSQGITSDDMSMMVQYLTDARLPDGHDQKEGMGTSDYLEMALDELRSIYQMLGGDGDAGDALENDEASIAAVREFAERNELSFEESYEGEEGEIYTAAAVDPVGSSMGAYYVSAGDESPALPAGLHFNDSEDGFVEITPAELGKKIWEG